MGKINSKIKSEGRSIHEYTDSQGWTPLFHSVWRGHSDVCEVLLKAGARVDHVDVYGNTPLSMSSSDKVCEILLRAGSSVTHINREGNTPLSMAAARGQDKVCEVLLKAGAKVNHVNNLGDTPLSLAAHGGHENVIKVLLMNGATLDHQNKDGSTPLSIAARWRKYSFCKQLIIKYGADCKHESFTLYLDEILFWAAVQEDLKMCDLLIDAGADFNKKSSNDKTSLDLILTTNKTDDQVYKKISLYNAAREGNLHLCEQLLEQHADPNLADKEGRTSLYYSCKSGLYSVADKILDHDSNPNVADQQGLTPLYFACSDGNSSLMEKLIRKGANTNAEGCLQVALDLYYNNIAMMLLKHECDINKFFKGRTALMNAAKTGSPEGIDMLLNAGADPNIKDSEGMTALAYGIVSESIEVIKLLAPITTVGNKQILTKLAQSNLNIEGEVENYLRKIKKSKKISFLLRESSFYGNIKLLDYLLNQSNPLWSQKAFLSAFENVFKTDKVLPVQVIDRFCKLKGLSLDKKLLIEHSRTRKVENLFDKSLAFKKSEINEDNILCKVPKSEEFDYSNLMEQIISLILETYPSSSGRLIKYETLIKDLHAQVVHYKGEHLEENSCPDDCSQKTVCGRIRDILFLLDQIMKKMSEEFPIFKDVICNIVGSIKEQTKVGKIDETDVLLAMSKENQQYFEFETGNQKLRVKKIDYRYQFDEEWEEWKWTQVHIELPDKLKPFVTKEGTEHWRIWEKVENYGYFDSTKYFITFMEQFYKIIESETLILPKGLQLSTKFVPCEVCKNEDYKTSVYVRCYHDPGCEEHAKRKYDPDYKESCQCRNFTSPCLSWSKIGVVLHLEFVNDDGTVLNLDVDVSPPSIPARNNKFDGSNAAKRAWLEKMRMPGWLTEWIKTEDMSEAATEDATVSIRLRFINPGEVIVEQTLLFLNENTLSGNKLLVYIIMKILRKCTGANLTSFKIKFAVHNALRHSRYETVDLGTSLERVQRYWTVREKFNGVEETLTIIGVKRVEVKKEGLLFVMDN